MSVEQMRKLMEAISPLLSILCDAEIDHFDWQGEMETGIVITDRPRSGYDVGVEGKFLGNFSDMDEVLNVVNSWMDNNKYWPNIFFVNDHGNVTHIDNEGNGIQSIVEMQKRHSINEDNDGRLDNFTIAYIEAALWSSTDNSDESGGEPLDRNYSFDDIHPETQQQMIDDCKSFQKQAGDALNAEVSSSYPPDQQAGHDFWLTREGHGAGFWDGDWPEPEATQLTNLSKKFGGFDLFVGDDGMIYGS